jgi:hypothetical protein
MATVAPIMEEAAGAVPFSVIEGSGVNIIFAMKFCFKASELDPFGFSGIAFGFRNLAYHARVHVCTLLKI